MNGYKCSECNDICYYEDEVVFMLGDSVVYVDERFPDWDKILCTVCAEDKGLI